MTELSDLYSQRIIELAAAIPPARHLDAPDATASAHSKLCGSTIAVELAMNDDRVEDYAQTVKACLLGQASAAIMARNIVGASEAELREVAAEVPDFRRSAAVRLEWRVAADLPAVEADRVRSRAPR